MLCRCISAAFAVVRCRSRWPAIALDPLQRVLHAAACTVLDLKLGDHVTPALRELHWLPITERIQYKLCLLVHKMFVGHAPDYIASLLTPASDIPSRSSLRSSSNCDLVVPRTSRKTGDRSFSVAATPCMESAADRLETLAYDYIIQEQTEEFSVSCCLHREHCVNSGMRHQSDCRGALQVTVVTATVLSE